MKFINFFLLLASLPSWIRIQSGSESATLVSITGENSLVDSAI
jgi:hypothetical protein